MANGQMVSGSREFFTLMLLIIILVKSESFVLNNATARCLPQSVACRCDSKTWYIDNKASPGMYIECEESNIGMFPDFSLISIMNFDHFFVSVTKNSLTNVPGGSFKGFTPFNFNTTTFSLVLSENLILKIDNDAFIGLENMDFDIDLSRNNLTELPLAFLLLNQLQGLYIYSNPIKVIDPIILQHIAPMIIYFQIGIGNLSSWPAEISSLSNLEMVYLHDVVQNKLPQRAFYGSEDKINDLAIFGSDLKTLPCTLTDLNMLEYLTVHHSPDLSATNLVEACRPNYTMSSTVHEIHLVEGALTEFPNILKYTPMLRRLNLYRNQIQHVNDDFIPINNVLTDLMLSYNRLQTIPNSFLRFQKLKNLILDNNNIATVEPALENVLLQYPHASLCLRDNPVNTTNLAVKCSSGRDSWAL